MRITSIIIILLLASCNQQEQSNGTNVKNINVPLEAPKTINLSSIADSIEYVKLESGEHCTIGKIRKIISLSDKFIILDKRGYSIFIFDKKGVFKYKINRRGRSNEEYLDLTDISYDPDNKRIIILDSHSRKLLLYSLDSRFIKTIALKAIFRSIEYCGDNNVAMYSEYTKNKTFEHRSKYPNIVICNLETEQTFPKMYFDKNINTKGVIVSMMNNFSAYNNRKTGFAMPLNDTIYSISNNTITPKYFINFGEGKKPEMKRVMKNAIKKNLKANDAKKEVLSANYAILIDYTESKNLIFLYYKKGNIYYYGFYYPSKNFFLESSIEYSKSLSALDTPIVNDIDGGLPFLPLAADDSNLFSIIEPINLQKHSKANLEFAKMASPNDNPIIMIARIKNEN